MSVIDPAEHADLIALQQAAFAAGAALDAHAPGVRGVDLTPEQRTEADRLRAAVRDANQAVRDALLASGLVGGHGWYRAGQDLKNAARPVEEA